jgi:ubiquinone/menaquinone biosynthesis C-methylase UbiE
VIGKHPFSRVADYYDTLMKGIDYSDWVEYTVELFKRFGHKPKRILDLACGTGTATIELARRGFEVTAIDLSNEMLEILKKKRKAHKIEIMKADMQNFKLSHPVDAVTCYFDSINYLTDERELKRCFSCVYEALAEEGIFLFDMNTIYGLEKVWGTNTLIREIDNIYSVWRSVYDASRHISTLYLTLFVGDGKFYRRVEEVHQERAYPMEKIEELLLEAGFSTVDVFAHMTTSIFLDISSRVMIAAEKKK